MAALGAAAGSCPSARVRTVALWCGFAMVAFSAIAASAPAADVQSTPDVGEQIYLHGILGTGAPLVAMHDGGVRLEGAEAACVNCHRRSGFGTREGRVVIPPIASQYLLQASQPASGNQYLSYLDTMHLDQPPPYSESTLAKAIRDGVDPRGRELNYLMPRFALGDSDMAALIAYLRKLDRRNAPGVSDTVLHFATIITPDADRTKRRAMLDVIERYFADRNVVQLAPSRRLHASSKMSWVGGMFMVNRRWQLHVWELTGPANTWEAQLKERFAREPVLAVVSGLGGSNWRPVHAFCEHQAVPCLFPNVEVPPADANADFYSLYFSKGVLLEAGLEAKKIIESGDTRIVHQIYRAGDSGEPAALAFAAALKDHGITVRSHVLPRGKAGRNVIGALRAIRGADTLALWLRPADLRAIGNTPMPAQRIYMSGLMGGLESAPLPTAWRSRTSIAYPFDLPASRRVSTDFALGWFAIRHIPMVDEQVQADTFLACGLLAETLGNMADTFVPEYLVERVQDMIEHRLITGYYPRLSLAAGQRFASKGGYLVHFGGRDARELVADSGWVVP